MTFSSAARAGASAMARLIAAAIASLSMVFLRLAVLRCVASSCLFSLLQQLVAQLGQPLQLAALLEEPVRVACLIARAGHGGRLFDQLPDIVTRNGDPVFNFGKRQ